MCSSRYRSQFQFYRSFVITEQYLRRLKCLRYYVLICSRISFFTPVSFSVRVFPFGYIRHGSQNSSSSSGIEMCIRDRVKRAVSNIGKGQVFDENFLMTIATVGALSLIHICPVSCDRG